MDDLVGTFKEFQGRLLAIGALIASGLGFNRLVQDVTKLNTELGFTSKTLGITAQQLSEWEQVGRTVGASSGEITQNLKSLNAEIQEFHATGSSKLGAFMGQVGIKPLQPNDTPDAVAKRLSEWYQGQGNKAYASHLLQSRGGLSQGMINLLSLSPEEIQKRLDQAKRFAPTDEEIKKFTKLTEAFGEMLNVIDRLATKAILPFVESLTKILKLLTDWLGKWAENNQSPAEAAGEGLSKMGLPELQQNPSKPSLIQRGWNWLRGNPSGGAAEGGGGGGGGANDNAPGGAAARPAGPGASPDSAQPTGGAARPAPPGSAGGGPASPGASPDSVQQPSGGGGGGNRLPGRDLTGTDPRLTEIVSNAARALPPGYSIRATSGVRSRGQGQHTLGKATDWEIIGPDGKPIPNRGDDTTGMYTKLARNAYGYQEKHHPDLTGTFQWGGQFGTSARNPYEPDLMHFDIGGRRGRITRYSRESIGAEYPPSARALESATPAGPNPSTQRSFDNWRNLGLGARGATLGPQSSISNSRSSSTRIESMNVSPAAGSDHSGSGDIQRRLGDYDNVQNSNTGMV